MRANWLWPLLIVVTAGLLFLQAFGAFPPAVVDLVRHAWPLALIVLGLSTLLSSRVRYGNFVVLGLSVIVLSGVITTAYNKQSSQFRQDYHETFSQAIPDTVSKVRISANLLLTEINVTPANDRTVSAEFVGSLESQFTAVYRLDQGVGVVTLDETRPGAIPRLDAIGHGNLTLRLPINVTIDTLAIKSGEGALTLDATGTTLSNLNVALQSGPITLTLPALPSQSALGGSIHTNNGDLTITVPQALTVKVTIDNGRPAFNQANYLLLSGGVLQTAGTRDFQVVLSVGAPGGVTVKP